MASYSKIPTYNLKVVIRETGIKPDTLRAWERRYGLPEPERSPGGHRLYSEYDIETIKWLAARQEEGLRINRAVAHWEEIIAAGQDPFQSYPAPGVRSQTIITDLKIGETIKDMREAWIAACLEFNEPVADHILAQAFARYSLETVCLDILRQGLSDIGELWYIGEATVHQEHFASALVIRRLNALLAAAPPPTRTLRFMVACPPGEEHIISPLMITLFLRNRGWDVIYLGANVPIAELEKTIRSAKPDLVVMTAMSLQASANLFKVAKSLSQIGAPLAYGGRIFNQHPDLRDKIPGYFLGESLYDVVFKLEEIITSPTKLDKPIQIPELYNRALLHFRDRQAAIESHIWNNLNMNRLKKYQLEIANDFLAQDISAGLTLGDLGYLSNEIEWIKTLLINHNIPVELLPKYLRIYRQALNENLGEEGAPIIEWINKLDIEIV